MSVKAAITNADLMHEIRILRCEVAVLTQQNAQLLPLLDLLPGEAVRIVIPESAVRDQTHKGA